MTLQVGMVAGDGILLASDVFSTREPSKQASEGTVWYGYDSSKIMISDSRKVAVTCARDMMLASALAEALIEGLTPEYWPNPGSRIKAIASANSASRHWGPVECLVALVEPSPVLFHLQCLEQGTETFCPQITSFGFAGDRCNAAIFWAMRYYSVQPANVRSVRSLLPLASQLILDAGKLNSGSIGGLEMVYSDSSGFCRVTESDIRDLEAQTQRRSKSIEELLFQEDQKS
jgi:hypothetical protein